MNFLRQNRFGKPLSQLLSQTNWLAVVYRLMTVESQPFTAFEAIAAIAHCLRFLQLVGQHPDQTLVPTREIDAVIHILENNAVFNRYFDHQPGLGTRGAADRQQWRRAFQATSELFERQFGYAMGSQSACCQIIENQAGWASKLQPASCEVCLRIAKLAV